MSPGEVRTVEIEWIEVSRHRATVNVPIGIDLESCDLANALADLDGFVGLEREAITVRVIGFDPIAEVFAAVE